MLAWPLGGLGVPLGLVLSRSRQHGQRLECSLGAGIGEKRMGTFDAVVSNPPCASLTSTSVSGRGMSTPGRTFTVMCRKATSPVMYCSGSPAPRRRT